MAAFGICRSLVRVLPALLLVFPCHGRATPACEFVVRYQSNDEPYTMMDGGGQVVGLSIDLIREALTRMGCTTRFLEMPWARALVALKEGTIDALPNTNRTPERESFALFSSEFTRSANALFIRSADRAKWRISRLADLRGTGFRLGVEIDAVYGEEYGRLLADPAFQRLLVPVSRTDGLWRMLETKHIDGVIAGRRTGLMDIRDEGLTGIVEEVPTVVIDEPDYVAFSRKRVSAEQVSQFDEALAAMRADGTYAAILKRYDAQ